MTSQRISGKARLAGVMGWPVGHSRSPFIHNHWLATYGIDGAYLPLAVQPQDFEQAMRALPLLGFRGANVTVPHKEAALACADEVDAVARRIGAANTLVVTADGRIRATNTDAFGFIENLRERAPGADLAVPAVVLGAGGAARAVIVALLDAGAPQVVLANRGRARAEALAESLGGAIRVVDWADRAAALEGAGLLVNTTTLGMAGQPALDLDLAALPHQALVTDIVYTPLMTPLLAAAQARGHRVVDGLGMLLHQARPGFAAWFGTEVTVTPDLRALVERDIPKC
ncbi:shikimate dehydrogenase [Zavarzinia sp. CC-PAN008]|uniref:shikimate dehydrogenase n=1 Tax=Zavarzinia sp. CC-PAN008 TaxID=3243332 RepID=UPI003F742C95